MAFCIHKPIQFIEYSNRYSTHVFINRRTLAPVELDPSSNNAQIFGFVRCLQSKRKE